MLYHCRFRQSARIMHFQSISLLGIYHIRHVRHGCYHVHIKFAVETFLHYLHVKKSEKATTEAETQCHGRLREERQRGIIELQFLKRSTQVFIFCRVNGIYSGKHHRLDLLESGNGRFARTCRMGYGIAHFHLLGILYSAYDISHLTGA